MSLQELLAFCERAAKEGAPGLPSAADLRQLFVQADAGKDGYLNDEEFFAVCEAVYPSA